MRFIVLLYVFISVNSACVGQNLLKQITTDEGLSDMQCFDVFQDSRGYMWIGTRAGINRYDGKDMIKIDRTHGLLSDHIYAFYEDSQNRIWINNLNGEPLFIQNEEVHNRFTDPYLEDLKSNNYLSGWCEDKYNRIWFALSEGKLKVLDRDTIFEVGLVEGLDSTDIKLYGVFEYHDEIIVITSNYIFSLDSVSFDFKWKHTFDELGYFIRRLIHNDKIYLFSIFDAFSFDLENKELERIMRIDGSPSIYDCRVINDSVFLSTSLGISIINDSVIQNYKLNNEIDDKAISAVHLDEEENLWIATLENGVYRYIDSDIAKSKYSEFSDIVYINEWSQDSVFIVLNSWKLLLIVNDELVKSIQLEKTDDNRINEIFARNGKLWIVDKYKLHEDVLGAYKTTNIYNRDFHYDEITKKAYWIGLHSVNILEDLDLLLYASSLNSMTEENENCKTYKIHQPYCFTFDTDNSLWIGGEDGLYHIDDGVLDTIEVKGSITNLELANQHLIGINYGKGIFEYNIPSGLATSITTKNGLPTNHFTGLEVNEDDIWVSHASGICQVHRNENGIDFIKSYGRNHGIPKGGISFIEVIHKSCHFVVNGFSYFIDNGKVMNDTLHVLLDTSTLEMYEDELRSIDMECINFSFADKMKYMYRLTPKDSAWTETMSEKVDLEYVPSGEYSFEVKASHPLNLITPITKKKICVLSRWYNEYYFKISVLLLFACLLYFLVYIKAISFNLINIKRWIRTLLRKLFENKKSDIFIVKDIKGIVQLIPIETIDYIKSSGNYLEVHTNEKKYTIRMTISSAVEKFSEWSQMSRVHRSYMVNINKVDAIDHKLLKIRDMEIPYTERYRDILERKLQL